MFLHATLLTMALGFLQDFSTHFSQNSPAAILSFIWSILRLNKKEIKQQFVCNVSVNEPHWHHWSPICMSTEVKDYKRCWTHAHWSVSVRIVYIQSRRSVFFHEPRPPSPLIKCSQQSRVQQVLLRLPAIVPENTKTQIRAVSQFHLHTQSSESTRKRHAITPGFKTQKQSLSRS